MIVTELETYHSAKLMIDQHGDAAILEASITMGKMIKRGDIEGRNVWLHILLTIEFMQDASPSGQFH